jgi:hypothetical protein
MAKASSKKKDLLGTYPAMLRAAQRAREVARYHGTPLVIMEKGKVVEIPPDRIKDLPKSLLKIAYGKAGYRRK